MRKMLYILGLLTDEDIDWLAATGVRQAVPAGTILIRERTNIGALLLLLEGQARVSVERPQLRQLAVVGPGEIMGELSFVDSRPASASVTTLTPAQVLRIPREAITARLKNNIPFAARFYQALAVFLAHRLRKQALTPPSNSAPVPDDQAEDPDELSTEQLEDLGLARVRSDWIMKRLRGW